MLSRALGSRTVLCGTVNRGKNDPSQSLQMMERALVTADELKSIPKGNFVVMKTGTHPMKTKLRLFSDWGITFGKAYTMPERANRKVSYANKQTLEENILRKHYSYIAEEEGDEILAAQRKMGKGANTGTGTLHTPVAEVELEATKRRGHVRTQ